jgi:DNA polymerase III subunit chi
MPRVDFYVLPEKIQRDRFACDVTSKARRQGNTIYIHTASQDNASIIDDLLWTFKDISFIPHTLAGQNDSPDYPVTIGWKDDHAGGQQVMVNLSAEIPKCAGVFARIVEIVTDNEADRQMARQRYRNYRDRGFDLHNHVLESGYDDS